MKNIFERFFSISIFKSQEHNLGRDNFALFLSFLNCVPGFEISPKMTHPYDPKASCSQGIYNSHQNFSKFHR